MTLYPLVLVANTRGAALKQKKINMPFPLVRGAAEDPYKAKVCSRAYFLPRRAECKFWALGAPQEI